MKDLTTYLSSIPAGPLLDTSELERLLMGCWHEFQGAHHEGMQPYKLLERMESVAWNPPVLTFRIARHGGTVLGSTRAAIHEWQVNLQDKTAYCQKVSYRQVSPRNSPLNVVRLANETYELIEKRSTDSRLTWYPDGSVRVQVGEIIPGFGIPAQTLSGRRKRFRAALDKLLRESRWRQISLYKYAPAQPDPETQKH